MKWVGCNTPTRDMTACCLNVCNCAQTYWSIVEITSTTLAPLVHIYIGR